MKRKISKIKREFKKLNILNSYKNKFRHKQMRFIISKLILSINVETPINELINLEIKMFNSKKKLREDMFMDTFKDFGNFIGVEANWKEFARFLFYVYQTSTYWSDTKKNSENIYNLENYVKKNSEKRDHYYRWLQSIPYNKENYNNIILKIMRRVF